jgi:hypothetical protein
VLGKHQNAFGQTGPVHHAAAAQHGVLLPAPRPRKRLARGGYLNARIRLARRVQQGGSGAGDAAQVLQQVHALLPHHMQRVRLAMQPQHRLLRRQAGTVLRQRLGAGPGFAPSADRA